MKQTGSFAASCFLFSCFFVETDRRQSCRLSRHSPDENACILIYEQQNAILQASLRLVFCCSCRACRQARPAHCTHKKTPVPAYCRDKSNISCGATLLDVHLHPLTAYCHMPDLLTEYPLRLTYCSFGLPSEAHSFKFSIPLPTNCGSL